MTKMFFNTKKKIANQVSIAVLNTLRPAFVFTEHLGQDGQFRPPYGFWMDQYIIGFTHQLICLFIAYDFNGQAMSAEKKGGIIVRSMMQICGENWQQVLMTANNNAMSSNKNPEFSRGANDAATMYGAVTGRLNPDDSDPILKQAHSLAEGMHNDIQFMGLGDSSYASLGAAISVLTINKHIQDRFLDPRPASSAL